MNSKKVNNNINKIKTAMYYIIGVLFAYGLPLYLMYKMLFTSYID